MCIHSFIGTEIKNRKLVIITHINAGVILTYKHSFRFRADSVRQLDLISSLQGVDTT